MILTLLQTLQPSLKEFSYIKEQRKSPQKSLVLEMSRRWATRRLGQNINALTQHLSLEFFYLSTPRKIRQRETGSVYIRESKAF